MPLTPQDVGNKRFTPVRLREGYDMGEVDQFLDEVEAELERLIAESDDLRAKVAAAQGGEGAPVPLPRPDDRSAQVEGKVADTPADKGATGSVAAAAPRETIKVVTAGEASSAALRLLELATKNADEVVAEAKEEAEQIVGTARTEAERLESETKARTDTLEQEARSRVQNLDAETETKRSELLGDMEREKSRLDSEVDTLRAFEREYRSRLKSYFNEQLQALDALSEDGDPPESDDGGEPRRLKSILGGDAEAQDGEPGQGTEENAEQGGPDESETPKV